MHRRDFLQLIAAASASTAASVFARPFKDSFRWLEATIPDLQRAMSSGQLSSVSLTKAYFRRIQKIDREGAGINSIIELNPEALKIARELDAERKRKALRGPMHGIPVLLKDNIDTADQMLTTAGSLALVGARCERDAFLVQRLRAAGAVILGKRI